MTNLLPLLYNHLDWHPSRIKCLNEMIFASIRCKTPHHSDMADYLSGDSTQGSKAKRIYRLFKEQEFNVKVFAELLSQFCPQEKWLLTLDRTNWESGPNAINIMALCVVIGSVSLPLFITLLPKNGASNSKERSNFISEFIEVFGVDKIRCLIADREFWDEDWIKYLYDHKIPFAIRIKKNLQLKHKNGGTRACKDWVTEQTKTKWHDIPITIDTILDKDLYIASAFLDKEDPLALYKKRWSIETCFKAFKTQGFCLERTQVTCLKRLRKLVLMLSIALALAIKIGAQIEKADLIRTIKANGSKVYTWFKVGLKVITAWLTSKPPHLASFFSCLEGITKTV